MNVTIEIARGLFAELPTTGALGEPFFCTDTGQLFVWNGTQQVLVNANAIEVDGITISGSPTLGSVLIGQGNGSAVFADPFVQGVYAPGTNVTTGGISSGPINPVLVGAKNPSGLLEDFNLDSSGNLLIAVANASIPVTGAFYPYALGQTVAASSVPVVLTAAQITALTPPAAITNYAEETGGNLATIATNTGKIPALGQALAAASVPVVLTAAQIASLTPPAAFNGVVSNAGTFAVQASIAASQTIAVTNTGVFVIQASSAMTGTVSGTAPSATDIIGGIYNTASPAPTNGQTLPLQLDISGALKTVSGGPNSTSLVTWTPTNGTINATQSLYAGTTAYAALVIESVGTGTISTGSFAIEVSNDNANWQPLVGYSLRQTSFVGGGTPTSPTAIAFSSGVTNTYTFQTFGFAYCRILIVAAVTGSGASIVQSYSLSGEAQPPIITNPSVVNSGQASTDVNTAMSPANTLATSGALAVAMHVAPGTTSLTGDPGANNAFQAMRTPSIFKSVAFTTATSTAVWTPTSKKFRLMRFKIILTSNCSLSAGAVVSISLNDGGTAFGGGSNTTNNGIAFSVFVPTTAVTSGFGGFETGWIDLGNGYLSTTSGNALNIAISTALATGSVSIVVCGTEE
jgi:hypothetical protein